jgi:hypothetical protein
MQQVAICPVRAFDWMDELVSASASCASGFAVSSSSSAVL